MKRLTTILFVTTILYTFLTNALNIFAQDDLTVFKKVDKGKQSFYMELLIKNPTKNKIEKTIDSLVKQYKDRKWLQIDIFDNLEALQRRGDEKYPTKLVYKHWLVSITNQKVERFYIKERPDIK